MSSLALPVIWMALFSFATQRAAELHNVNPQLQQPVKMPSCLRAKIFYVSDVADSTTTSPVAMARTWTSPNPPGFPPGVNFNRDLKMIDVLWQRPPVDVLRETLVQSLSFAGNLAKEEASADYSLSVALYRFGLAEATWREYYSKLEMLVRVKNLRTGATVDVPALGTCVRKLEAGKGKPAQAIQSALETALERGVINFLFSAQLKSAVQ